MIRATKALRVALLTVSAAALPAAAQTVRVESVTPALISSDGSTEVTIAGEGFEVGAVAVFFGLDNVTDLVVVDEHTLRGKAPALFPHDLEPGPRDVVALDLRTHETFRLPEGVTYFLSLGLKAFSPREVSYLGKTPFVVQGQGFTQDTSLVLGDAPLSRESLALISARALGGVAPPHAPTAGPIAVRAMDPLGGEATLAGAVTYIGPLEVTAVTPRKVGTGRPETVTVVGVGFTPETAVEIGGQQVPGERVTYLDARTLSVEAPDLPAGEYDVAVADSIGSTPVRASLEKGLRYVTYEEGDPAFRLRLEAPRPAGAEVLAGVLLDELRNVAPGTSGYSLSIAVEGECELSAATTGGTVGAPALEGGRFDGGFQLTELTSGPANRGVVHATILSLGRPAVLDPEESPHRLLELHVKAGVSGCSGCRLELRDGLSGTQGPVANAVTYGEAAHAPELFPGIDIDCGKLQLPGDANQDGRLDISDAVSVLGFLFLGTELSLPCGDGSPGHSGNVALLDANGDARVDLSDPVRILSGLFLSLGVPAHVLGNECVAMPDCREGPSCAP
ncbi:MAG: IPT/TIG domain-containing protein [Planctomycetes bacterium]|nr:IPT/TIG domain-containing protein [Planctomycetota bacterium]